MLPTVREIHPALRTPGRTAGASREGTAQGGPAVARPRRQELAPWSPHLPQASARDDGVTPAGGSPEGADGAGRHGRVRRHVGSLLIAGVGVYLGVIALGMAGVLFVGRLSPPGLGHLARPTASQGADADADRTPFDGASKSFSGTLDATVGAAAGGDDATSTDPDAAAATASGSVDPSTGTGPSTAGELSPASSAPGRTGRRSTSTTTTTTTTTEAPSSGSTPPNAGSQGGPPDEPPGKP